MTADVVVNQQSVLAGAFLARATYGGEYIDPVFDLPGDNDAERNDDYRAYLANQQPGWQLLSDAQLTTFNGNGGDAQFTSGGLYNARVDTGVSNSYDAQGLVAAVGDTLVLSFRGTDYKDPAVLSGQTFIGPSLVAHYEAFKPLIDAVYDYVASHPEIHDVVVSGHSLGGAMVDIFTLVDAARFRDLRPNGLTMVSLASSGIPPDLPEYIDGIDHTLASISEHTVEILGEQVTISMIDSMVAPDGYLSIANGGDRAHFPDNYPDIPEAPGLVPIVTLKDNLHFDDDAVFRLPNIGNTDVIYRDPLKNPLDFRGMGAEHNSALLWTNIQGLLTDPLHDQMTTQQLIVGIADYNAVPDWDGSPIALFDGYRYSDDYRNDWDRGAYALVGSSSADYILGLTGNDQLSGGDGADLLSGGAGSDIIRGGAGTDQLAGGTGRDTLTGDAGGDSFLFAALADSGLGKQRDIVRDFRVAQGDQIDVSRIDAVAGTAGDQAFDFIGTGSFTAEGQIVAIQSGSDTLLRFNVAGVAGSEMDILLKNVLATTLQDSDFIL